MSLKCHLKTKELETHQWGTYDEVIPCTTDGEGHSLTRQQRHPLERPLCLQLAQPYGL